MNMLCWLLNGMFNGKLNDVDVRFKEGLLSEEKCFL